MFKVTPVTGSTSKIIDSKGTVYCVFRNSAVDVIERIKENESEIHFSAQFAGSFVLEQTLEEVMSAIDIKEFD